MKAKRVVVAIAITALVLTIVLISVRAYYVAIALVAGTLIMGHREIWSLLRKKKLPVIDERVRENINKSVRNGFVFFALALAFLMLPFSVSLLEIDDTVHVLGGVFVAGGVVYLLSYLFYDRAEPGLSERGLKMLKIFILVAAIALGSFIISIVLHNAMDALFGVEEPVFFIVAVFISPLAFVVGIIGSLVMFVMDLLGKVQ